MSTATNSDMCVFGTSSGGVYIVQLATGNIVCRFPPPANTHTHADKYGGVFKVKCVEEVDFAYVSSVSLDGVMICHRFPAIGGEHIHAHKHAFTHTRYLQCTPPVCTHTHAHAHVQHFL